MVNTLSLLRHHDLHLCGHLRPQEVGLRFVDVDQRSVIDDIVPDLRFGINGVDGSFEGFVRIGIDPKFRLLSRMHLPDVRLIHVDPHLEASGVEHGDQVRHLQTGDDGLPFLGRHIADDAGDGAFDAGIGNSDADRLEGGFRIADGEHGFSLLLTEFMTQPFQGRLEGCDLIGLDPGLLAGVFQIVLGDDSGGEQFCCRW